MSDFKNGPVRYLITRGDLTPSNFQKQKAETLSAVRFAARVGIELVQIREKQLEGAQLFELAAEAVACARDSKIRILVNERFDVALAAGADGVHLTSRSIPCSRVRNVVPHSFMIGVSTHSEQEVRDAGLAGADFALFGNVFATPGKREPAGLEMLSSVCASVTPFPVLAVGGIDETNFLDVLDAGASGYAAIRFLNEFVSIGE